MPKESSSSLAKVIGYLLGTFVAGLVIVWYDHLFLQCGLGFWVVLLIGIVINFACHFYKLLQSIMGLMLFAALILQILSWAHAVTLPLIKHL